MQFVNPNAKQAPILLSSAQMRGMEQAAFASGKATPEGLMRRAAEATVAAILTQWPHAPARTAVLCGPGNNGGDGYMVAALLRSAGWQVEVHALAPPRSAEAQAMRALWGDTVGNMGDIAPHDLQVDALFGIGGSRPFHAPDAAQRVAVDIPSGLDADSGIAHTRLPADLTVTFQAAKPGHYLADGPALCGRLHVADIGLTPPDTNLHLAAPDLPALRKTTGHKYSHGHALILGGNRGGAARLTARAALRVGAGLVTLAPPPESLAENAARLDAVMLDPLATADDLTRLLHDARLNALCLGPGLGRKRAANLLPAALAANRPTVIDADALQPSAFHETCVLTPHMGEFARLFPDLKDRPKIDATRAAAERTGCTVLLKGHDTTIADPSGRAVITHASYDRAAPWLATAGSGDVLAGMITGLLARGFPPFEAAETAAWLHIEAARSFGAGLIAEDLPEELPRVFRAQGL